MDSTPTCGAEARLRAGAPLKGPAGGVNPASAAVVGPTVPGRGTALRALQTHSEENVGLGKSRKQKTRKKERKEEKAGVRRSAPLCGRTECSPH